MFCVILVLVGCSSFCFGGKDKDKNEEELPKAKAIENIYLEKDDVANFQKRTDQNYQGIVLNNRSIVRKPAIDLEGKSSKEWLSIQPHLNQFIYREVENIVNSQVDAQEYINLLLSLMTDGKFYQAVVLESNEQAPYFPGKYIFITRSEIENSQDEAVLSEILSYRLVRNDFLNNNIDYSLFDFNDIKNSLTEIIQKDRDEWEKYSYDSTKQLNVEVINKIAVMMIRAGYKPSYTFSLDNLPGYHPMGNQPHKSLENITPLKRHKKVFD